MWNESVLRYHFCRSIATFHPGEVDQFVECDRIDLVLVQAARRAFIEFKFYARRIRFDAYGPWPAWVQGGPRLKNLREFQWCIDKLHVRASTPGLSKYVVLVYADARGDLPPLTYAEHYEEYQHPRDDVLIRLLEEEDISATDVMVRSSCMKSRPHYSSQTIASARTQHTKRRSHYS